MPTLSRIAIVVVSLSMAGCGTMQAVSSPPSATGLTDTAWTLLAYRPAAPGAADIQPARPDQYRVHFLAGGRLSAQIDCNRGNGNWEVTAPNMDGGRLHIGAMSLTRMMCPPDQLGSMLPQQIESVQSYRIADGRLYLELGGGHGQYVWTRSEP